MIEDKEIQNSKSYIGDDLNFRKFIKILWATKNEILLITSFFAIFSVVLALNLTNYYKSVALLAERSGSGLQGNLSQFSGLAAAAGIDLQPSDSKAPKAIELIKSRKFVKHLISFEKILPSIMAAKGYDSETKEIIYDRKIYDPDKKLWVRKPKKNQSVIPSFLEAHEEYRFNILSISQNKSSGFITVEVEHVSPIFAKEFLDLIIKEANEILRKEDMEDSQQGIEYLSKELSKNSFIKIKDSISTLIEGQLETQMKTKVYKDYFLIKIDPPFIAEKKSSPSRALICIFITIFGGLMSILYALIKHYFFKRN